MQCVLALCLEMNFCVELARMQCVLALLCISYAIMSGIMTTDMLNLYDLALPDLEALLHGWGQPAYRARQIYRQLYIQPCHRSIGDDRPAAGAA